MFDLDAAQRQARSLEHVEHRPWPLPDARLVDGRRRWRTCCSRTGASRSKRARARAGGARGRAARRQRLARHRCRSAPPACALRGMLPVPGVSSFLELNVRTYVRAADGKPGVWFFSLDASSRLAVEAARRAYKLPVLPRAHVDGAQRRLDRGTSARASTSAAASSAGATAPRESASRRSPARWSGFSPTASVSTRRTSAGCCSGRRSTTSRGRCSVPRPRST